MSKQLRMSIMRPTRCMLVTGARSCSVELCCYVWCASKRGPTPLSWARVSLGRKRHW